jgi:hypothetical protein
LPGRRGPAARGMPMLRCSCGMTLLEQSKQRRPLETTNVTATPLRLLPFLRRWKIAIGGVASNYLCLCPSLPFAAALRHVGPAGAKKGEKLVDLEIQRLTPRGFVHCVPLRGVRTIVSREEFQFLDARSSDVCPSSVMLTDSIIVPQRASVPYANGLSFSSVRADFSSV